MTVHRRLHRSLSLESFCVDPSGSELAGRLGDRERSTEGQGLSVATSGLVTYVPGLSSVARGLLSCCCDRLTWMVSRFRTPS